MPDPSATARIDTGFSGAIPQLYERLFVPMIFADYARDLAARVARAGSRHVLETAAGTGAVTRALAAALPADARIVATDLNQPMLDYGAAASPEDTRITRQQADALALPFADRSFDAVVCQFGAMFFPDKAKGYAEARRVLAPGGCFWLSVWDRLETSEFATVVDATVAALFPDDPPHFMARTPHGYHELERIRRDLQTAGFTSIAIETLGLTSRSASARDAALAFCQGTPLRNEIEARDPARLAEVTDRAAEALAARFGAGAIEGRMSAHVAVASG
jgi:ubiquinone/menaquinone biosynthesis C-methylase UbiE